MILVPMNLLARIWRRIRTVCNWPNVLGAITVIGGIGGITRMFFGPIATDRPALAVYFLLGLSLLFVVYFWRGFLVLRKRVQRAQEIYKHFHNIAECLRELMCCAAGAVANLCASRPEADCAGEGERYIGVVEHKCKKICEELKAAFTTWGYNIDGVCVKYYEQRQRLLHVVERAGREGQRPERDWLESEQANPFFKFLREVHSDHPRYTRCPEVNKIRQNRVSDGPRFLAVGDIGSSGLPNIFGEIMESYAKKFNKGALPPEGTEQVRVLEAFRERSEGYDSCLGMMICKKHRVREQGSDKEVERIAGFIGVDSTCKTAWDFLDPHHMHLIAAVADALYPVMEVYDHVLRRCGILRSPP